MSDIYYCDRCKYEFDETFKGVYRYCPNCGIRFDHKFFGYEKSFIVLWELLELNTEEDEIEIGQIYTLKKSSSEQTKFITQKLEPAVNTYHNFKEYYNCSKIKKKDLNGMEYSEYEGDELNRDEYGYWIIEYKYPVGSPTYLLEPVQNLSILCYTSLNLFRFIIMECLRKKYPSDISRKQFEEIRDLLEGARKRTRPRTIDLYDAFCGVLYIVRTGCQWRMLPGDFPMWRSVHAYFQIWSEKKDNAESILEQALKKISGSLSKRT